MNKICLYLLCIIFLHAVTYMIMDKSFPFTQIFGEGYHKNASGYMNPVDNSSFSCTNQQTCNSKIYESSEISKVNRVCLIFLRTDFKSYILLFSIGIIIEIALVIVIIMIASVRFILYVSYIADLVVLIFFIASSLYVDGILVVHSVQTQFTFIILTMILLLIMKFCMISDFYKFSNKKKNIYQSE